ncbi:hypothetical protein SKAU_G00104400 [Synaphobranchus kaupii]|uniref:Uncharacterized protein n=1 Tax=Synaphobranchus kaupii TaxID=118154 RepID=A0A9Q1J6P4_SYNKA|nr:hypothetical protein SKAU_G00104400 [Synaphobranchus kaupii]
MVWVRSFPYRRGIFQRAAMTGGVGAVAFGMEHNLPARRRRGKQRAACPLSECAQEVVVSFLIENELLEPQRSLNSSNCVLAAVLYFFRTLFFPCTPVIVKTHYPGALSLFGRPCDTGDDIAARVEEILRPKASAGVLMVSTQCRVV